MFWKNSAFLGLLLGLLLLPCQTFADMTLAVPVEPLDIKTYHAFVDDKMVPPEEIADMKSQYATRTIAEMIIVLQALHAADFPVRFEFIKTPNPARSRVMIRDGIAAMSIDTNFSMAITENVYVSSAVIPAGAFVKGLYGHKNNIPLMNVKNAADLHRISGVSNKAWEVDWATMDSLGLAELRNVPRYPMMLTLVDSGKVDFALLEFPARDDLVLERNGVTLHPVPGVKVGLVDSRHFMVSKVHPKGKEIYEALEKGLAILRKEGRIERYYREVGFYNHRVSDWKLLNPQ